MNLGSESTMSEGESQTDEEDVRAYPIDKQVKRFIQNHLFSEEYVMNARELYQKKKQEYLIDKKWFRMIDVLDDTVDLHDYGNQMFTNYPTHNSYVPVRYTIMPKPDFDTNDEMSYRFNSLLPDGQAQPTRIDLTKQINPLKPFRTSPKVGKMLHRDTKEFQQKFYKKRRISQTKRPFMASGFGI